MTLVPAVALPTDDEEALALTIWGEARGEDRAGKEMAASVILNRQIRALAHRAKKKAKYWWGETIAEICTQAWQFSCWNDDDPNLRKLTDGTAKADPAWPECLTIARQALAGEIEDRTGGATHYLNPKSLARLPAWATPERETRRHGRHVFYRVV